MLSRRYFCGLDLDIAGKKISASLGIAPWKLLAGPVTFPDSLEGYQNLVAWLQGYHCMQEETVLCIEATGYCAEPLTYFLAAQGYSVAIEPLVKVRRTCPQASKSGTCQPVSQHIAKYAFRFLSELHLWNPSCEILEKVKHLLASCDLSAGEQIGSQGMCQAKRDIQTVDLQMRQLLAPQPSIANDWPCY